MAARIRRYSGDLEAILKLDRKLIGVEIDDVKAHVWFVAEVDGEIVGYAGLKILRFKEAYLTRSGVLKEHRGQGIQKKLIRARERYARRQGAETMLTYTLNNNWRSIKSLLLEGYHHYEPSYAWSGKGCFYWYKSLLKETKKKS